MGLLDADVAELVLRVDVEAEPVQEHLDVGRAGVAGEGRPGLAGELAGAVLDVFDAGVAAVGGVDEVDLVGASSCRWRTGLGARAARQPSPTR